MPQDLLRGGIARVGICADRLRTEGSEPVIDDGCDGFACVPVAPIWLAQPIAERRLVTLIASAAVEADAPDNPVGSFNAMAKRRGRLFAWSCCTTAIHSRPSESRYGCGTEETQRATSQFPIRSTSSLRSPSRRDRSRRRAVSMVISSMVIEANIYHIRETPPLRPVAAHLIGRLILALAEIDDVPKQPIGRPFDKADLDDHLWPDPMHPRQHQRRPEPTVSRWRL